MGCPGTVTFRVGPLVSVDESARVGGKIKIETASVGSGVALAAGSDGASAPFGGIVFGVRFDTTEVGSGVTTKSSDSSPLLVGSGVGSCVGFGVMGSMGAGVGNCVGAAVGNNVGAGVTGVGDGSGVGADVGSGVSCSTRAVVGSDTCPGVNGTAGACIDFVVGCGVSPGPTMFWLGALLVLLLRVLLGELLCI